MTMLAARLADFRRWMTNEGLDGFIIWRGDMFSGEEVRACDERLAFISGFTGSAGYAVILKDEAYLLSDGRYHLQMQDQLDSQLWQWRDANQAALAEILSKAQNQSETTGVKLGFDGHTTTVGRFETLPTEAGSISIEWCNYNLHPIDQLWQDRPVHDRQSAYALSDDVTGQRAADKIQQAQHKLKDAGLDGHFISAPDCVNWLLNIRGYDLANTPFHLSFAYLPAEGAPLLCGALLTPELAQHYNMVSFDELASLWPQLQGKQVSVDPATLPFALYSAMQDADITLIKEPSPLLMPKAQKNRIELAGFDEAHLRDALAFCQFWYELEKTASLQSMRETDLVALLQSHRQAQAGYLCDSFDTIMGSGPNGAIIHYRAMKGEDSLILHDNLLLIDSGAHYQMGTTDITRTLVIGTPSPQMSECYSAVLCAHAALAMSRFPKGTTGQAIDAICRAPLWEKGLDFAHGTGHGVGHILSVHEGPASISKRGMVPLETGMVLSNEPGYYQQGAWGIRLENLVSVYQDDDGFYGFNDITIVPFERRLINKEQLDEKTCRWVNRYHAKVAETLVPHLDKPIADWLLQKTAPLD